MSGMNGQLSHSRKQSCAIDAHTRGGSAGTSYATFGLAQNVRDPLSLSLAVLRDAVSRSRLMKLSPIVSLTIRTISSRSLLAG